LVILTILVINDPVKPYQTPESGFINAVKIHNYLWLHLPPKSVHESRKSAFALLKRYFPKVGSMYRTSGQALQTGLYSLERYWELSNIWSVYDFFQIFSWNSYSAHGRA
jgi:hypothetical protein